MAQEWKDFSASRNGGILTKPQKVILRPANKSCEKTIDLKVRLKLQKIDGTVLENYDPKLSAALERFEKTIKGLNRTDGTIDIQILGVEIMDEKPRKKGD